LFISSGSAALSNSSTSFRRRRSSSVVGRLCCFGVYAYVARGDLDAPRDFPTFEDGHREMLHCDAILESARTGRWVDVPA
jgi:hypothetical protein